MSRIEFMRYERVWQTRKVIWNDADWEAFKLTFKKLAEGEEMPRLKQYYTNIYEAIENMSFASAIKEYNEWRDGVGSGRIIVTVLGDVLLGALMHEALSDAADEVEAHVQSICDSDEYIDTYME